MANPFASLDATAQAELVRSGDASATELVEAAIDAIDATADLNAVIHRRDDAARREAAAIRPGRQPFAGVPLVVKDLDGFLAGEPYHAGSKHLRDAGYRPEVTSDLIARLIRAGFVIVGKTNTPELGLVPSTEPLEYGPSHNPWDVTRTPGGSSGGSAGAGAAGVVPVGHAGDGGGSIRIPASMCGLVGLKPSRGRITLGPTETEAWGGLVARLVLTRSVRDTAAVLDAVCGPAVGDPYWAAPPDRPYLDSMGELPRLRIGWTATPGDGSAIDPSIAAATEATAQLLANLGHEVVEADDLPSSDADLVNEMTGFFLTCWPVWTAQSLDQFAAWTGTPVTAASVEPHTWALAEMGRATAAVDFAAALDGLRLLTRRLVAWWSDHDVLLTPTVGEVPPVLGQFGAEPDNPLAGVIRATPIVSFVIPYNISGQPAVSLPLCEVDGLPVGMQLVGAPERDDVVLALAAQLEAAAPWSGRRPSVWAG